MIESLRSALSRSAAHPAQAAAHLLAGSLLLAAPAFAQCNSGPPIYEGGRGGASSAPSAPSSPGPTGPTTPGPTGPTTPSPGSPTPSGGPATGGGPGAPPMAPATGGPGGPAVGLGPRGRPLVFTHGETSKKILQIDWDYVVWQPPARDPNSTSAALRRALPADEALRYVAGDDPRPLLVLRECPNCAGTDLALLSREFTNERTILLTSWFHCVKLPTHVAELDHPFHSLFPDHRSHLFLAQRDGSHRSDLAGDQSQSSLWKAMGEQLRHGYEGSADRRVGELLKLLAQFDVIDDHEARLLASLDRELESRGADTSRVRELQRELQALGDKRNRLLAREKELRELELREPAVR